MRACDIRPGMVFVGAFDDVTPVIDMIIGVVCDPRGAMKIHVLRTVSPGSIYYNPGHMYRTLHRTSSSLMYVPEIWKLSC